jgi:molecular chaperone GrpE
LSKEIEYPDQVKKVIVMTKKAETNTEAAHKKYRSKTSSGNKTAKKTIRTSVQTELKKQIDQLRQEREDLRDQFLRTLAEMDNMKKRLEKEKAMWQDAANANLLLSILPVVDDMERSLKIEKTGKEFRQGIEMIFQKLNKILSDHGVKVMESVGKPFDVEMHDALMQIEKKDVEPGMVIDEHEKGYFLNGHVLRHAKVLVSK